MDVVCFDFDGVICDSAPETGFTAWKACRVLWPEGPEFTPALQAAFQRVRPALHTGWEAIPLLRLLETGAADDDTPLDTLPARRDALVAAEGLEVARLQALFGETRDALIATDQAAWLRWNRFYPGIGELLEAALARHELYILTTKQERFASLLLSHNGLALPAERIHGLERGRSKPELLRDRIAQADSGQTVHFIEDRLDTLLDVIGASELAAVRLYLADWGYNTPSQREEAAHGGRIQVVDVPAFRSALGL